MRSAAKRDRCKTQREAAREKRQQDPTLATDEDMEVVFPNLDTEMASPIGSPDPTTQSPPTSPISQGELDYTMVMTMVQKLNAQLGDIYMDNDKIRTICDNIVRDYRLRD